MKKNSISLSDLRSACSCLLSLALKELFPGAFLVGSKVTPIGFYCDFSLKDSFDEQCLKQIEEVMQAWIRQKIPMQVREMVSLSAKEYFLFHKEPFLAQSIENSSSSSFYLAQILDRMVPSESSLALTHLGEIGAFKLQKIEKSKDKLRIYGTAFFDKQDLKDFLKDFEGHVSHVVLGKEKGLFEEMEPGEFLWFPKGETVRSLLKNRFALEESEIGFKKNFFSCCFSRSRF